MILELIDRTLKGKVALILCNSLSKNILLIEFAILSYIIIVLDSGHPASRVELLDSEWEIFKNFRLITAKPLIYICNVQVRNLITIHTHPITYYDETICVLLLTFFDVLDNTTVGRTCRGKQLYKTSTRES